MCYFQFFGRKPWTIVRRFEQYQMFVCFIFRSVGEHDGVYMDKRFFKCPSRHGIIVPIEAIHVLVPRDVSRMLICGF